MNFLKWTHYFRENQNHFDHLNWEDSYQLSIGEKKLITSSIRQFQRGEYSEGKHFIQFAKSMGDESYCAAVKVFITEEQGHAMVLGKFMEMQNITKLKNDWLDNVFRSLRKLAGLEGTVTVLLTAEIIAMVYYKALESVTNSHLLRQICKQILVDEEMHLVFQSFTLSQIYSRKATITVPVSGWIHAILMAGTIVMVWFFHKKVLRSGGYGFFSFFISVWKEFSKCRTLIKNKAPQPVFASSVASTLK